MDEINEGFDLIDARREIVRDRNTPSRGDIPAGFDSIAAKCLACKRSGTFTRDGGTLGVIAPTAGVRLRCSCGNESSVDFTRATDLANEHLPTHLRRR